MSEEGASCTPNIGPRERAKRMRMGLLASAAGVALAGLLVALGVGRAWRLAAFLPLWVGAVCVFQSLDKT